ncbi:DUF1573 domain-containing protein [Paenactinomyces guangxiensis]|uniref:DUF1573 domain-containing protein n=1 Tax=Paenactinomyces guangxiensis TaxID=1490290 RepID=A0A7W2A9L8_9BACL|nr:DUF1573 domain-containing protein [Paenactinomyces guangxiensis]MBA4495860.1 DUF1573 domain-containing protein [Paenactinomyces guangxiensis]MBH8593003.1 DUF1573 domain-containing protein [Paenactinomyces guangxiensis]
MSEENHFHSFQQQVGDLLLRHRSFLDVTSKFQESNARINRALMKAVTDCGCIEVEARRQSFPKAASVSEWKEQLKTHLSGELCDHCLDVVKSEMGKNLFYLTALCNLLDIRLLDVIKQESNNLSTLGVFTLR